MVHASSPTVSEPRAMKCGIDMLSRLDVFSWELLHRCRHISSLADRDNLHRSSRSDVCSQPATDGVSLGEKI